MVKPEVSQTVAPAFGVNDHPSIIFFIIHTLIINLNLS